MLLKEIRKQCEKDGLFHLASYRHNKNLSLQDWLLKFFNELNIERSTLTINSECDTPPGKRRSLGDIYRIARTYYSNLKLKDLIIALYAIRSQINDCWCYTIEKHVFYSTKMGTRRNSRSETFGDGHVQNGTIDEYGKTLESYTKLLKSHS